MVKMTNHRPPSLSSANCQKSGRYPWKQACKTLGYLIFLLYCGSGCLWIKMSMFCAIRSKKDKKHKLTFKIVSGMLRICNINADESRWVLQAQNCSGKAKGLVLIISVHVSTLENTLIYQLKCGTAVQGNKLSNSSVTLNWTLMPVMDMAPWEILVLSMHGQEPQIRQWTMSLYHKLIINDNMWIHSATIMFAATKAFLT